jgi:hypothetical protein
MTNTRLPAKCALVSQVPDHSTTTSVIGMELQLRLDSVDDFRPVATRWPDGTTLRSNIT